MRFPGKLVLVTVLAISVSCTCVSAQDADGQQVLAGKAPQHPSPARSREDDPDRQDVSTEELLRRLESDDWLIRNPAAVQLGKQHAMILNRLTAIIADEKAAELRSSRELAAMLLAQFSGDLDGMRDSIPTLIEDVEYFAPMTSVHDESRLNGYPCALALRGIGHTSVAYILNHLQVTPPEKVSDKAMELYAHVMLDLCFPDTLDECIAWVEVRAERATRIRRGRNFERLLVHLNEYNNRIHPKP